MRYWATQRRRRSSAGVIGALLLAAACSGGGGGGGGGAPPPPNGGAGSQPIPDQGASGSQAFSFLQPAPFSRLLVEVDFIEGSGPDSLALDLLQTRLNERCNKPGGITLILDDAIPDQGITNWSIADLRNVESQFRDNVAGGDTAVLYFLYVNGGSDQDSGSGRVLGVSYTGSSLGMFKGNIQASSGLLGLSAVEQAVIVHEAGHALGLVNNGIPMVNPHQDPNNGQHDQDDGCVMHFSIETDAIAQITGNVPNQFGADCINDMRNAGGN